jgi:hypothetical protein
VSTIPLVTVIECTYTHEDVTATWAVYHRTGKPCVQKPRTPKLRCDGHGKKRFSCGRSREPPHSRSLT